MDHYRVLSADGVRGLGHFARLISWLACMLTNGADCIRVNVSAFCVSKADVTRNYL